MLCRFYRGEVAYQSEFSGAILEYFTLDLGSAIMGSTVSLHTA